MIYSFPYRGKTAQVDLDEVTEREIAEIRMYADGPSKVRARTGEILEIDNKQFDEEVLSILRQNLTKHHYHPMDYDAPVLRGGGKERIHEFFNPGERGEGALSSIYHTGARTVGGLVEGIRDPGKRLDVTMARTPETKAAAEQRYQEWRASADDYFERHGGKDIYSGMGAFIPDILMIIAGAGTGGAVMSGLRRMGIKSVEDAAARKIAQGIGGDALKEWVFTELKKPSNIRAIVETAGRATAGQVPRKVASRTMAAQTGKLLGKTAVGEFATGATYGALKSGGDIGEAAKTGATFAAFAPAAVGIGALGARKYGVPKIIQPIRKTGPEQNRSWGAGKTIGQMTGEKREQLKGLERQIRDAVADKSGSWSTMKEYYSKLAEKVGQKLFSDFEFTKKYSPELYEKTVQNLGVKSKAYQIATRNLGVAFKPVAGYEGKMMWRGRDSYVPEIVSDVAAARRANEIAQKGFDPGPFYSEGAAEESLAAFETLKKQAPELGAAIEETITRLHAVNDRLLRYWLEKGVINQEIYDRIKATNEFYMPWHRVMEEAEKSGGKTPATTIKTLKGGEQATYDVIENMAMNHMYMIPAVEKHVLVREMVDALPDTMKSKLDTIKAPLAMERGVRYGKDGMMEDFKNIFVPQTTVPDDVVMFLRNGVWEQWRIKDPMMVDFLKKTYEPSQLVRAGMFLKHLKRVGVTANPIFMTRNAARDYITRIMNDGNLIRDPRTEGLLATATDAFMLIPAATKMAVMDFPKAAMEVIAGSTKNKTLKALAEKAGVSGEFYRQLQLHGAGGSEMREVTRQSVKSIIREATGIKTPMVEYIHPRSILKPIEWLEELGRIIEATPRLDAAHKEFLKTGNIDAAARAYRKITADFGHMGTVSKGPVGQVTPFFSASFAGMKAELDAIKNNPIGWGIKAFELSVVPTITYWLYRHNDKDYKRRDMMDKNMYYFLTPTFRIPKGYGVHAFIGNSIERLLDRSANDPESIKGLWEAVKLYAPQVPTPTFVTAPIGVAADRDLFFGTKIEPHYSEFLPGSERIKPSTTEVAKFLGKPFKSQKAPLSPAKIDFLIRDIFGGFGATAAKAVSAAATSGRDQVKPAAGLEKTPFVEAFATKDVSTLPYSGEISRFFENMNGSQAAYNLFVQKSENNDTAGLQRLNSNREIVGKAQAYGQIKQYRQTMTDLNNAYKTIQDPAFVGTPQTGRLTPEQKREILDAIGRRMNETAEQANTIYYQYMGVK